MEKSFEVHGTQKYLVFQPKYRYFHRTGDSDYISEWKSEGLSDESINSPSAPNNILDPSLDYTGTKTRIKLNGSV